MTGLQATGNGPGGYGPGGGYGPPPGGGFGGPPPGGGFGGPPPGGYGPPGGGYGGPPPGGYGGPPMPPSPPQKKGPNVGLIVGLGCLGLLILGGIGFAALLFGFKRAATAAAISSPVAPPPQISGGSGGLGAGAATGTLKAELRDLRDFKGDFGKVRYFVGEIYNTGDTALGYPSAKITLLDASNTAIDSGICASVIRSLAPGEKVPCAFSTFKAEAYATSKTEITPARSYSTNKPAELKVEGIKFTPKKGYTPSQLEGKITNLSAFKAKSVWALVSLYGADGKIVGAEQALVAGSDLDAGQSALFSAKIYNVAAPVQTHQVKAIGYGE